MGFERRPIDALDLVVKMGKAALPLIRNNCKPQEMYEAMLDVIAAAPAVSVEQKWTPISDPPKKPGYYLCYFKFEVEHDDTMCENYYYGKGRWLSEGSKVTHWMPLPAPPKEVTPTNGSNRNS